ncbi:MAG: ATP--dephospho-CoA triphosphoribosyl transferase CitG [Candidatus Methanomethylicota archaeon]|uniref:ATP--dephospho-CoA triphosphoribosyl transferase CitG n=1 Tax=Thermoproteota archaeon TaxID=2056631 RepID=A0A497ETY7_9CREN|nr:MAG: ATP--dephospho-CoA triphosphoribosyl transferase CitG [Candidatus Verstraetearchaeota archaeon]
MKRLKGVDGILRKVADEVVKCAQLAMLLEVSSYPKPGNVHRLADHPDTKFEHYVASAVAAMPLFYKAAKKGIEVAKGIIGPHQAGIGKIVRDAVKEVKKAQRGGNTCLGSLMLLTPLTMAACYAKTLGYTSIEELRSCIPIFTENTTSRDAAAIYEAIRIAKPGGLGKAEELDVTDKKSIEEIYRRGFTVSDVFKIAKDRDSVAKEWITCFHITFNIGFPAFKKAYLASGDFNKSTIQAFLEILSKEPDSLIMRKAGYQKALEVSRKANIVLSLGGAFSEEGLKMLYSFDEELRSKGSLLNPGSTADLTCSTLMVALLNGFKP